MARRQLSLPRFLLFPHSVGHLSLMAFLTPHRQSPVMRELTNARRPPSASGSPGAWPQPEGAGKYPYSALYGQPRHRLYTHSHKTLSCRRNPRLLGRRVAGPGAECAGRERRVERSLRRRARSAGLSPAGRPPGPRRRAPWLWAPAGRTARGRWAAAA
eukprot:bmy_02805T0